MLSSTWRTVSPGKTLWCKLALNECPSLILHKLCFDLFSLQHCWHSLNSDTNVDSWGFTLPRTCCRDYVSQLVSQREREALGYCTAEEDGWVEFLKMKMYGGWLIFMYKLEKTFTISRCVHVNTLQCPHWKGRFVSLDSHWQAPTWLQMLPVVMALEDNFARAKQNGVQ